MHSIIRKIQNSLIILHPEFWGNNWFKNDLRAPFSRRQSHFFFQVWELNITIIKLMRCQISLRNYVLVCQPWFYREIKMLMYLKHSLLEELNPWLLKILTFLKHLKNSSFNKSSFYSFNQSINSINSKCTSKSFQNFELLFLLCEQITEQISNFKSWTGCNICEDKR